MCKVRMGYRERLESLSIWDWYNANSTVEGEIKEIAIQVRKVIGSFERIIKGKLCDHQSVNWTEEQHSITSLTLHV